jgi:tetratricopeptide (TPR) repeat protein
VGGPVYQAARSGPLPPLDEFFHPRPETGLGRGGIVEQGSVAVLTPSDDGAVHGLGVLGGSGKTQLAAAAAHTALSSGTAEFVVWVNAACRPAILTGYAAAAADVGAAELGEEPEQSGRRFLAWLAATNRRWLMVLDDLARPADLERLWPAGPAGQVIVTARAPDPILLGPHRRVVQVGGFSRREALAFLSGRLTYPDQRIGALDLAGDLLFQPLGLSLAAALMAESGVGCREYRDGFAERRQQLAEAAGDGAVAPVTVCWTLAIDRANQLTPPGLAWPALVLIALLDPNGVPAAALTSPAACAYITGRAAGDPATAQQFVRTAVQNLARLNLVSLDPASIARTVRVHPVVQAAVRAYLPPAECERAAAAAATALLEAWPASDTPPLLAQSLRDSAARLRELTGDLLLTSGHHPLLIRAGRSLGDDGLHGAAIGYWQEMADTSGRLLGPEHTLTLLARDNLAAAYEAAGRADDAIGLYQAALSEQQQAQGGDHPDTLAMQAGLARAHAAAGRLADAITLYEQTLAELEQVLGPVHPDTLELRAGLAAAVEAAGHTGQALAIYERTLADCERAFGPGHESTLAARENLAAALYAAGQPKESLTHYKRILADRERVQGPDHPDTLGARGKLAYAYRSTGRMKEAIPEYRRTLADRERVQGPDHPDTLGARANLASAYHDAGRVKEAIPLLERNVEARTRMQGPDHPDALTARGNLASVYHSARRLGEALPLYEQVLADCERVLGPGHADTLTMRANLAHAYLSARRLAEAITLFERTLADCERALGVSHPLTAAVRESLTAVQG